MYITVSINCIYSPLQHGHLNSLFICTAKMGKNCVNTPIFLLVSLTICKSSGIIAKRVCMCEIHKYFIKHLYDFCIPFQILIVRRVYL